MNDLAMSYIDPALFTKGNENICQHKDVCKSIHSSSIHNSSKLETTQVSLSWDWIHNPWCLYNGLLSTIKTHAIRG